MITFISRRMTENGKAFKDLEFCMNTVNTKDMLIDRTGCLPDTAALSEFKEYKKVTTFIHLISIADAKGGVLFEIEHLIAIL